MKPIIGILGNLIIMENGMFPGLERSYVNNDYINAVLKGGGSLVIIPVNTDKEVIKKQIEMVDGVLISGGWDVNPQLYGEETREETTFIYPEVDEFDLITISIALELKKPILGVCRGLQILNVSLGGTLYQDNNLIEGSYIKHTQSSKRHVATHKVDVKEGSILEGILGKQLLTNSYHHQSVNQLGKGLKAIAYSKDGIIEAIEKEEENFVVGVQWHPEMMVDYCDKMEKLFKYFINICSNL
ncbi:gamma-glutamyl-gamma-aminobutyrate hydrolase family protein [Clostridioides difficile]|uniref:gamma-glutamyl-gamma-aminobutyrate hydrolase family protein n=1 Tax=Clostridioides difficile TaxID=1496 RepID=UPI001440E8A0|nr:gamma-glutamyl-gamma-aminobutyrate hydrolase family protein [Clostridioides difficile]MCM0736980.1 gamma-glutamyl-gamma-aminobutyrate hydrolase family protein [Clostridioides difficile]MCP8366923.1 gamma-glutamyl-gamma-aminobutyrate hydrolase family protein [Clostridioides difficile]MCP8381808.1 gamma-glutamyl-gamma-aminobutyrate hydrolase family protein [Clostridioides difficile]MCW0600543.1 gamma-glutamyl-gamma-aminobutyrate hydrolase family protein [Clostridioides difficile]NKN19607.1 ga